MSRTLNLSPAVAQAIETHRRLLAANDAATAALLLACDRHDTDRAANPIFYISSIGPMRWDGEIERSRDAFGNWSSVCFQYARRAGMRTETDEAASAGGVWRPTPASLAWANDHYRSDMAAWMAASRLVEDRWTAMGGAVLADASDETTRAEMLAWAAFLAAPAPTAADMQAKAEHVLSDDRLIHKLREGPTDAHALLSSIAGRAPCTVATS